METAPARINLNFLNEATSMMISSVVKTSGMVEKKRAILPPIVPWTFTRNLASLGGCFMVVGNIM